MRSGLRLDGNLMIVADRDVRTLAGRLQRIGGHGQRIAWGCGPDEAWPSLTEVLRRELPEFDAFEERDAVRGTQLVGRAAEVASLRTRIVRGDAVIGRASAELAQRWTGGHPLLHRQFGSALRSVTRIQDPAWGASTDRVAEQAPPRFIEREAVLDVMREVVAERGGPDGAAGRTLRNFGLVTSANALAEGLAWYLARASLPQSLRKIA